MGNSVADWKTDLNRYGQNYRDRENVVIDQSQRTRYWTTGTDPAGTMYSSGSASRIVDRNNPAYHRLQRAITAGRSTGRLRLLDLGHPFALERTRVSMPTILDVKQSIGGGAFKYFSGVFAPTTESGGWLQNIAVGKFPSVSSTLGMSQLDLWGLGSTAVRRSLPDVPQFSLFRSIGELREGLPQAPLKLLAKEKNLRSAGGEYLNFQFGVAPTVSDMQKFIGLCMDPKLRARVKHQLDEEHRVRKTLDKGKSVTTTALTGTQMATLSGGGSGITGTRTVTEEYRIWSSISFVYYQVDALNSLLNELDAQLGSFGLVPTAVDIWNLIPWSWFVDWFANFNHVITNLSYLGRDGLLMRYGYVMGHFSTEIVDRQSRDYFGGHYSTTCTRLDERKYRVKASPYGFGLSWNGFSPFQSSILGALGVSRMRY